MERYLEREGVPERSQVETTIFHLTGRALDWYADLHADGRLPERMSELKRMMAKKFDKTYSEAFAMRGNDLRGYVRGLENVFLMVPEIPESTKREMFLEGLSSSLYPLVSNHTGDFNKLKNFALDILERIEEAEVASVFRVENTPNKRTPHRKQPGDYTKETRKCYRCGIVGHLKRDCKVTPSEAAKARGQL